MKKSSSIFLSIIFILFSIFSFNIKGYFNVRAFSTNKRPDIERFMNLKYSDKSYVLTSDDVFKSSVKQKFDDVADVSIQKNLNMTVSVTVKNKDAFGKISDGVYLSNQGRIFYSNLIYDKDLPIIVVKDFNKNIEYLNSDQLDFIKKLNGYPQFTIYLLTPFGFDIVAKDYSIEVPQNFSNMSSMAGYTNTELKNSKSDFKKLVVLKDKIVFKN